MHALNIVVNEPGRVANIEKDNAACTRYAGILWAGQRYLYLRSSAFAALTRICWRVDARWDVVNTGEG